MHTLHAARALLPQGWQRDVRLTLSAGRIATVEAGQPLQPGDEHHALLLPGMANLHSHAHQRGMAGLAEHRGPVADSFWTWREAMYRHALVMQPDVLVCGRPMTMAGEFGPQAEHIDEQARAIASNCGLPLEFVDERLSSREAKRILRERGLNERSMRGRVDMVAASLFLQSWLDARRN